MSKIGPKCKEKVRRGRPKKRPEYNREQEINDLIQQVVNLYAVPYDDRNDRSSDAPSINVIAQKLGISRLKVRKLLITAGYYSSKESRDIQHLHSKGYDVEQICNQTGLKKQTVNSLLPYRKGVYNLNNPPLIAENCRTYRMRKQACEQLTEHMDEADCREFLWNAILAFEQYPFPQKDGSRIQYSIHDNQLFLGDMIYSRAEVEEVFLTIRKVQKKEGRVTKHNCQCSEELYSIFLRIGACKS